MVLRFGGTLVGSRPRDDFVSLPCFAGVAMVAGEQIVTWGSLGPRPSIRTRRLDPEVLLLKPEGLEPEGFLSKSRRLDPEVPLNLGGVRPEIFLGPGARTRRLVILDLEVFSSRSHSAALGQATIDLSLGFAFCYSEVSHYRDSFSMYSAFCTKAAPSLLFAGVSLPGGMTHSSDFSILPVLSSRN
ncbi:hypothetical protein DY000_02007902 [Brassica cretica]|uniref:Uncharacterized protein n=1 Tax=Brassica cretica TaxID=69181 RepID=A0ABQ7CE90_BRACR|nr:hypothetical protein DY000_02007902 [Brassica cretica]